MAKRKRRAKKGRRGGGYRPNKQRVTQMSLGCFVLLLLLGVFLVLPRMIEGWPAL
jgi:hypothetical protein